MKPEDDVELQEDGQAKDCRVEEELEVEREPATSTGANDVHVEDNESLNDSQGSTVRSTCEEPTNGSRQEAVSSAHRIPGDGNCENEFLDGTHEKPVDDSHDDHSDGVLKEPVDENRDDQFFDDTRGDPVIGGHEKTDEGTREQTVGSTCEELGGGTREKPFSSTNVELVPGSHDEPINKDTREATTTGTLEDSSSHHEHQSPSESQPDPPRHRGRPKYKRLLEFDNLRPSL